MSNPSSTLCADRLLLQRLRKSQSGTALYGDSQQAAEDLQEPSVYQTYENASQQRLIVVANRLPVSAVRERDGSWSLQVHPQNAAPPTQDSCAIAHLSTHTIDPRLQSFKSCESSAEVGLSSPACMPASLLGIVRFCDHCIQ